MSEILSADLKTIGIVAICFIIGFAVIWSWLGARSEDKTARRKPETDRDEP